MNILFVLYGGITTNSFLCLARFAQELDRRGHGCAAVLHGSMKPWKQGYLGVYSPQQILKNPRACFENGQQADIIHAWTPRQNVADFVLRYQKLYSTPLFIYSEDNEEWIAQNFLGSSSQTRLQKIIRPLLKLADASKMPGFSGTQQPSVYDILEGASTGATPQFTAAVEVGKRSIGVFKQRKIPPHLSDPSQFRNFLALADSVGIISPHLKKDLPDRLPAEVLLPGVDLKEFSPREPSLLLKEKYHLDSSEKLILYCGGLNSFTAPSLRDLCCMVSLLNQRGYPCRLVRSGIGKLSMIDGVQKGKLKYILDLGLLPRSEIPQLMSLADVFVQPGRPSPFEEGRFPCKIIEFMAMSIPTILPDSHASSFMRRNQEVLTHATGSPEEMAACCEKIFQNPSLQNQLRQGARHVAEQHFDIQKKTTQLEQLYRIAQQQYQKKQSRNNLS